MNNKGNVLIIGGGKWQVPMIRFFQQKGHPVYVVDPYEIAHGVLIADHHIPADIRAVDEIKELVKDLSIEMVVSDQSDIAISTVAALSAHLNLPGNSIESVNLFRNKYEMRRFARFLGIPVPPFSQIHKPQELSGFLRKTKLPVIVKPPDSQSSRGIGRLEQNQDALCRQFFSHAFKQTELPYVIAESFLPGTEITIEGVVVGGKHKCLAFSQKEHFRLGVASSLIYPAKIPSGLLRSLESVNDLYVEKSGLQLGLTHAEYIVDPETGRFDLIEIACRGGGTLISSDILKWVSGVDAYELYYRSLHGEIVDIKSIVPDSKCALLKFFEFPAGKVQRIEGLVEAAQYEGVAYLELSFEPEDMLQLADDDRSRHGFVIIYADTESQLMHIQKRVLETIRVEYYPSMKSKNQQYASI